METDDNIKMHSVMTSETSPNDERLLKVATLPVAVDRQACSIPWSPKAVKHLSCLTTISGRSKIIPWRGM